MKIFVFTWEGGEKEWILAPSKKAAKEFVLELTGCVNLDGCKVELLPKKLWSEFYIIDINEPEPDSDEVDYDEDDYCDGYKIVETFEQYAARTTTTSYIAATDF